MNQIHFGDWEAIVVDNFEMLTKDIYLFRRTEHGRQVLDHTGVVHTLKQSEVTSNDHYFARLEDDQLQALADGLSKKGIETESNYKIEGLLEATKLHLDDMRALVFNQTKTPKNENGVEDAAT